MKQRKPTKEESDAMDNYGKPLKPQPELPSDAMDKKKKGGMTKGQKKVGKVMSEFKAGKLKSSSGKKVTNPKQAIAIGLSEADMSKNKKMGGGMMSDESFQYSKGGMVRGQGAAIKGTKFKGIF
jgi:hypothetical protein